MAEKKVPIAKAYVEIIPSMEGSKKKISEDLGVEVEKAGDEGGKKFGSKFKEGFGKVAATVGKAAVAATTAAVAGVVALTKQSVDSYAEFEQLQGGAELLFGEGYDFIMKKSEEAYKTIQMSQNDYLAQVNGLSTGLKTALDGDAQAAAELADRVVTAEADVVAATGASQESVQNAFNGIMKSNFSMLDNLQLGITPTKAGFQEIINKVNEWNEANGNATDYQIENLADCQSALVDYIEMQGLANYASEEGTSTIQGSLSSLGGAWQNLLTGLASGTSDLTPLIDNVVNSALNVVDNISPVVQKVGSGLSKLISGLAPVIEHELPNLVEELLPSVSTAVLSLVTSLTSILPSITTALSDLVTQLIPTLIVLTPILINGVFTIIQGLIAWLASGENTEMLVNGIVQMVTSLVNQFALLLPVLLPAVVHIISEVAKTLTTPENIKLVIDALLTLVGGLVVALAESLPEIIDLVVGVITNLGDLFADFLEWIVPIAALGVEGIVETVKTWGTNIKTWLSNLVNTIKTTFTNWLSNLKTSFSSAFDSIKSKVSNIMTSISGFVTNAINKFKELPSKIVSVGRDLISGLWNGISDKATWVYNKISNMGTTIINKVKGIFGVHSPSRVFAEIGGFLSEGLGLGFEEEMKNVQSDMLDAADGLTASMSSEISANAIAPDSLGSVSNYNGSPISINVYGAEGQSVDALADAIAVKLEEMTTRRGVVYA